MAVGPLQLICFGVGTEEQKDAVAQALRAHSQRGAIRVLKADYVRGQGESLLDVDQRLIPAETGEARTSAVLADPSALDTALYWGSAVDGMQGVDTQIGAAPARRNLVESVEQVREQITSMARELSAESALYMALIEHRWAPALKDTLQSLRDAFQSAGVVVLAERMIRPSPLALLPTDLIASHQAPMP
jgi:hypothetical protein